MGRALPKFHSFLTLTIVSMATIFALSPAPAGAGDAETPISRDTQLAVLTPSDAAQAGNRLGYDVFGQLLRTSPLDENLLISPYSLSAALSIVAGGADGATAASFRQTLHQEGLTDGEVAAAEQALQQSLAQSDPATRLSIANALWGERTVTFKAPFIARAKKAYDADIAAVDFAAPGTLQSINAWASGHTNGMIPTILDQLDPKTTLVVTNAVYFKGLWADPFAAAATMTRPFHLGAGKERPTPIMVRGGLFGYYETADSQAIQLPYDGHRLALTVLLPKKGADDAFAREEALDRRLDLGRFSPRQGRIGLPRFSLAYDSDLSQTLRGLGLAVAFTDQADFRKMTDTSVKLDKVIQRTAMIVDEKGTEAAAVTGTVTVLSAAAPTGQPFEMIVDRPFFVALRNSQTGAVLFLGRVAAPGIEQ